jgi:hypothetical protein
MEPVGAQEIAELLSVKPATVHMWRQRGLLPAPRWTVSGAPAWDKNEILVWATHTNRATESEMVQELLTNPVAQQWGDLQDRLRTMYQNTGWLRSSLIGDPMQAVQQLNNAVLAVSDVVSALASLQWPEAAALKANPPEPRLLQTGDVSPIRGVYRGQDEHDIEAVFSAGDRLFPCPQCGKAISWRLASAAKQGSS